MPRVVRAANTKAERRAERSRVGPLSQQIVNSQTVSRYESSFASFLSFCGKSKAQLEFDVSQLDALMAQYVEHLWKDGEPKSYANYAVASLQHMVPSCRRHLTLSWKLVGTWNKLEFPIRATPLSPDLAMAFAGIFFKWGWKRMGCMVIVAFSTFLRTGEMFRLRKHHVVTRPGSHSAVLYLQDTKTSQRQMIQWEKVIVEEKVALDCLGYLCRRISGDDLLLDISVHRFRKIWSDIVEELRLQRFRFQPYSIRRGGATSAYRRGVSFDELMSRGRWSHLQTARIYLDEGVQELAQLQISPQSRAAIHSACRHFARCKPVRDAW